MSENAVSVPGDEQCNSKWREELISLVTQQDNRFHAAKDRWNWWYYSSMYGAVLCSALSALVLKLGIEYLRGDWQTDVAALLATLAAILGTVSSTGNFERRWRTSRIARAMMQKLKADLTNPKADLDAVTKAYKKAIDDYQEGAVGNDA